MFCLSVCVPWLFQNDWLDVSKWCPSIWEKECVIARPCLFVCVQGCIKSNNQQKTGFFCIRLWFKMPDSSAWCLIKRLIDPPQTAQLQRKPSSHSHPCFNPTTFRQTCNTFKHPSTHQGFKPQDNTFKIIQYFSSLATHHSKGLTYDQFMKVFRGKSTTRGHTQNNSKMQHEIYQLWP